MELKEAFEKARLYDDFVENFKKYDEQVKKVSKDRIEYGYDSLCLRIDQLITELALYASGISIPEQNHYKDYDYWKYRFSQRAIRIYDILDDLLERRSLEKEG